ncbi:putative phosphohydrolase (ISS) [Mitosporidium daphniae]|uniref:Putative phosphohydrolase (ISS) n=1 Tax=Mitosporidium daphniae TaxID=1485682 RepID=A0A098VRP7_9MICR|nr:putative phosphohydrolase (ISS) [Mitosporidium daphniae]KGG51650.1 putative phosphohydrolase (ISS) [Mitosporidium daphniae]|eukprot:XP_013238077.1 putative phosphohydrolase (ISS) [Mitosporidium daphniae]
MDFPPISKHSRLAIDSIFFAAIDAKCSACASKCRFFTVHFHLPTYSQPSGGHCADFAQVVLGSDFSADFENLLDGTYSCLIPMVHRPWLTGTDAANLLIQKYVAFPILSDTSASLWMPHEKLNLLQSISLDAYLWVRVSFLQVLFAALIVISDVSDIDTSLREASEELGVNIEEHVDEIIGVLPPTLAKHELLVVPVLALMKGYPPPFFAVSNSEVAKTFIVPLDKFLQSKFHSTFEGIIKSKWSPRPHQQHPFRVHTFNIEDTCGESVPIIWGMTAQILIQISQLLYPDRKSEFQFEPPEGPSYSELAQAYFKFKINSAK